MAYSWMVVCIVILDSLTEEQLKEYWRKKLEGENIKDKDGNLILFSDVAWELCMKYPKIANEIGVDCPKCGFGVGALIVLGVIIIMPGITWTYDCLANCFNVDVIDIIRVTEVQIS